MVAESDSSRSWLTETGGGGIVLWSVYWMGLFMSMIDLVFRLEIILIANSKCVYLYLGSNVNVKSN